jgi:hypothetical protein
VSRELPGLAKQETFPRMAAVGAPTRSRARRLMALVSTVAVGTSLACSPVGIAAAAPLPLAVRPNPAAFVPDSANTANTAGCALPVTTDVYDGFRVGVPTGWQVSTFQGEIEVSSGSTGTQGVLIYPALLTKGVTAKSLFSSILSYEQGIERKEGGSLSYVATGGSQPTASLSIRSTNGALVGRAGVFVLPLRTAVASTEGVFYAYWAPSSQFAGVQRTETEVASCYQPVRATLFRVFQANAFTFTMPPGWSMTDESQDFLQLSGPGGNGGVDYELWGPFVQGVNATQPITSAPSAISYMFNLYKITVTHVISSYVLPSQQASSGVADGEYMVFDGLLNGKPQVGVVNMEASIDGSSAAGVIRLGLASPAQWNAINGGLIQMMGAIQHNFTGDLAEIAHVNQQFQDFLGQSEDFDDVLNSQQLVEDPTTGDFYEAAYDSWEPDGPDGPGYYLPDGQLLNPVQRS